MYFSREFNSSQGFNSTSKRFASHATRSATTSGPAYTPTGMADAVKRRLCGRRNVFGSTARRFTNRHEESAPGPGAYYSSEAAATGREGVSVQASTEGKKRPEGSAAFVSTTKRWGTNSSSSPPHAPEPGQYNVNVSWKAKKGKGIMESTAPRFNGKARGSKDSTPGPGFYNSNSHSNAGGPRYRPRGNKTFVSAAPRFDSSATSKKNFVPGPGSYDVEYLYGNLNKQTFNTSIAEQLY